MNSIASTGLGDGEPVTGPSRKVMRFAKLADVLGVSISKLYRLRDTDPDFKRCITIFTMGEPGYPYVTLDGGQKYLALKIAKAEAAQKRKPGRPRKIAAK
jgi:hypothetical protein